MIARLLVLAVVWCLIIGSLCLAKGRVEHNRYYSEDGEYSIDFDRLYPPTKETSTPHLTTTDFPFNPPATINGLLSIRTIEWFKLDSVVPNDQYEATAKWLIQDHEAHRFHDQSFEVKNARSEVNGLASHYDFIALGQKVGSTYGWHGMVFFFGDRVALVSEIVSPVKGIDVTGLELAPSYGFTSWARTLRREGKRN